MIPPDYLYKEECISMPYANDGLIDNPRSSIHPSMRNIGGGYDHDRLANELAAALEKTNTFTYLEFEKFVPLFQEVSRQKMLDPDTPAEEKEELETLRKEYDEVVDLTKPVTVTDTDGRVLYMLPPDKNRLEILSGANSEELDRFVAASKRLSNSPISQIEVNKSAYSLTKTLAANQDGSEIMQRAQQFAQISYDFDKRMGRISDTSSEPPTSTKQQDKVEPTEDLPPDQLLFE